MFIEIDAVDFCFAKERNFCKKVEFVKALSGLNSALYLCWSFPVDSEISVERGKLKGKASGRVYTQIHVWKGFFSVLVSLLPFALFKPDRIFLSSSPCRPRKRSNRRCVWWMEFSRGRTHAFVKSVRFKIPSIVHVCFNIGLLLVILFMFIVLL